MLSNVMAALVTKVGVLIAILVFSAPVCYFAYLGMREQRNSLMPRTDTAGEEDLDTTNDRPA